MQKWKKVERKVVKQFGGRPTSNSGASWWSKGDGRIGDEWRQEVKSTEKNVFRVTDSILRRLEKDAARSGGTPLLIINFEHEGRRYCVVPAYADTEVVENFSPELLGKNVVEPYSLPFAFKCKKNRIWKVLPEDIAKIRLRLANS